MAYKFRKIEIALLLFSLLLIAGLIYGWTVYDKERVYFTNTKSELENQIAQTNKEKEELEYLLLTERNKNSMFEDQIRGIASTVGNLKKLSETDKELLQKYSKIYFLNEHYTPSDLSEIPIQYLYQKERDHKVHARVLPFLEQMLDDAKNDGTDILVISSYRSFGEQSLIKSNYTFTYGAGTANQFSADQGYSEHQLGTAVDFTTSKTGSSFTQFKTTPSYEWLLNNAHKYGFTLSYPDGNAYYQFEPWHWRFVGKTLANKLFEERKHFYDLDQREIDQYLISIFD